jgi:AcrR family transcriptional regulator
MSARVKSRRYDATGRRARAAARRSRVLDVAEQLMLRHGYEATTVAAIADQAGVSVETVYKSFGGKPGLAWGLYERGLAGSGTEHAETRSGRLRDTDPATLVRGWSELATEVAPRVAPLQLLVRTAAASDPRMQKEYDAMDASRLTRMRENAAALAALGGLREGITVEEAGDVLFSVSSSEMYDLLVVRRGWTVERYARYVRDTITHALLP